MARRLIVAAAALAAAGCAQAPGEEEVCRFLHGRTATPGVHEGAAWEWSAHAQRIIASSRWVEVDPAMVRRCTGDSVVERVTFASRGRHAQVTLNTFLLPASAEPDQIVEGSGFVATCLYRREREGEAVRWTGIACKLDAVS